MSKTVVVGDIHGRMDLVERLLNLPREYNIIFLGDFLDSYTESKEDQVAALRTVMFQIETSHGRVKSVRGNHENSYTSGETASGWSSETQTLVNAIGKASINKLLVPYIWEQGFLITHAGVTNKILRVLNITLEEYLRNGLFSDVGKSRGGPAPYGGLYWCDWYSDFEPIPDVPQIVGHTGYRPSWITLERGVLQNGNSYNVDCLDHKEEFLLLRNGLPYVVTFEDLV